MPDSWDSTNTFSGDFTVGGVGAFAGNVAVEEGVSVGGDVTVGGVLYAPTIVTTPVDPVVGSHVGFYSVTDSKVIASGDVDNAIFFPLPSIIPTYSSGEFVDTITIGDIPGGLRYLGDETKLFQYNFAATMSSSSAINELSLQVFKNDVLVPSSKSTSSIILTTDRSVVAAPFLVELSPNDKLNGYITASAAGTITVQDTSVSIHQI